MRNSQTTIAPINQQNHFSLMPKTFDEALQFAKLIAESDFCPKEHKGKPGNILITVQYGAELGLSPMQALQNISIINGRPCLWGDALLGLVMAHSSFVNIHEEVTNGIAYCTVWRKNKEAVQRMFSIDDAKKANLWGKGGTWTQYPNRMLQLRARTFALRDLFPDVLKGLTTREEVEDYEVQKPKQINKVNVNEIEIKPIANDEIDLSDFTAWIKDIKDSETIESLESIYNECKKQAFYQKKDCRVALNQEVFKKKQALTLVKEFNEEIDQTTGEIIEGEKNET